MQDESNHVGVVSDDMEESDQENDAPTPQGPVESDEDVRED